MLEDTEWTARQTLGKTPRRHPRRGNAWVSFEGWVRVKPNNGEGNSKHQEPQILEHESMSLVELLGNFRL